MTPLERRAIDLEAHRQTYWQAMREQCAIIRKYRRRGCADEMAAVHYRLLWFYLREWAEARKAQRKVVSINRRAA